MEPQLNPTPTPITPTPDPTRERKILIIAAVVSTLMLLITVIAIVTAVLALRRQPPANPAPVPTASEPTTAPPTTLTKYATDAGLLKLRSNLATLSGQVDTVDLFEAEIASPNLDLSISIPPQQ